MSLQDKPFHLLIVLLQAGGKVVTRGEIRNQLWPEGTFVEFDDSLNAAVKKLRAALNDSAEHPRFLETVPKVGYRFIAPVTRMVADSAVAPVTASAANSSIISTDPDAQERLSLHPELAAKSASVSWSDGRPRRSRSTIVHQKLLRALAILFFAALVLSVGIYFHKPSRESKIQSIVVLPLENLSGNPQQQYFVDGMTDELITDLAKVSSLSVISRTSAMQYKGTKKTLPEIGRELSVDAVVEGSVVRSENAVRITVQLISAPSSGFLMPRQLIRRPTKLI